MVPKETAGAFAPLQSSDQRDLPSPSDGLRQALHDALRHPMVNHPEPKALLRETLEKHIHDLAEELVYWMDELSKLDTTSEGTELPNPAAPPQTAADRWAARTGRRLPINDDVPASGK